MADIMYRVEGDYLIPELILDGEGYEGCPEEEIGRYGELRERFLWEHRYGTYMAMHLMAALRRICRRLIGRRRKKWNVCSER